MRYLLILMLLGVLSSFSQAGTICIIVRWTAPGGDGDGDVGKADRYELRYAEGAAFIWDEAVAVPDSLMPRPFLAGVVDNVTLSGMFKSNSNYYFAVKARDEAGNWFASSKHPVGTDARPRDAGPRDRFKDVTVRLKQRRSS